MTGIKVGDHVRTPAGNTGYVVFCDDAEALVRWDDRYFDGYRHGFFMAGALEPYECPLKPGDVVSIPWQQERYEVVAVDGEELWAKDADGDHLTLAVDTCERVKQ